MFRKFRDLFLRWFHSGLYQRLERYFVSRWWEKYLDNKLSEVWERGEEIKVVDLPKEIEPILFNPEHYARTSLPKGTTVQVFESSFGTVHINWQ